MQSQTHNNSQQIPNNIRTRMASSDSWSPLKNLPTILMTRTSFKVNEDHLLNLAIKARLENRECGYLSRRGGQDPSSSPHKWQLKWFVLYQNLLFYYDNVNSSKPQGVYFLESCYSTRSPAKNSKDGEKLVSLYLVKFLLITKRQPIFHINKEMLTVRLKSITDKDVCLTVLN
jgi:hypothetical protein